MTVDKTSMPAAATMEFNTYIKEGPELPRQLHGNLIFKAPLADLTPNTNFHLGFVLRNTEELQTMLWDGLDFKVNYNPATFEDPVGGWSWLNLNFEKMPGLDGTKESAYPLVADGSDVWTCNVGKSYIEKDDETDIVTINAHFRREFEPLPEHNDKPGTTLNFDAGVSQKLEVKAWWAGYEDTGENLVRSNMVG